MARTGQDEDLDFANRQLCPDGACIGVLDASGICKVCGQRGAAAPGGPFRADPGDGDDVLEEKVEVVAVAMEGDDGGAFDPSRELCPDGACIGVIGANGRCKVCGKPKR